MTVSPTKTEAMASLRNIKWALKNSGQWDSATEFDHDRLLAVLSTKQEGEEWTGACRHCPAMFRTRAELEEHERECLSGRDERSDEYRNAVLEEAAKVADMRAERYRRLSKGNYSDATKAMAMMSDEFTEHAAEVRALSQEGLVAGADGAKLEKALREIISADQYYREPPADTYVDGPFAAIARKALGEI
jgi:hypothetical protein